jgi:hypothetical protein
MEAGPSHPVPFLCSSSIRLILSCYITFVIHRKHKQSVPLSSVSHLSKVLSPYRGRFWEPHLHLLESETCGWSLEWGSLGY